MRIFSAMPYMPFKRDLNNALVEMGHDVVLKTEEYSACSGEASKKERKEHDLKLNREKPGINKRWVEEVKQAHEKKKVDLFISTTDNLITYPETIEKIKKLGIPTLNLAHDDIPKSYFDEQCQDLALAFDYNWTVHSSAIESYKKIGANVIYVLGGANPHLFKPYDCERKYDVIFMGRNKGYRRKILKNLVDKGVNICALGEDWRNIEMIIGQVLNEIRVSKNKIQKSIEVLLSEMFWYTKYFNKIHKIFGCYISFEEMVKMYSQSKISLNFPGYFEIDTLDKNIDFDKSIKGIKGRDFEAPMSGAFYLTQYSDEIAHAYKIGEEIATFRNIPELTDKIKYYLENPDEAESIRIAGRQRALSDYTWQRSLENVFETINISRE